MSEGLEKPGMLMVLVMMVIVGLAGFGFGLAKGKASAADKPKPAPQAIQWIGKLTAGDGSTAVFTCREIEVGLGEKGALVWRRVDVPQMTLKSTTTNAEAK